VYTSNSNFSNKKGLGFSLAEEAKTITAKTDLPRISRPKTLATATSNHFFEAAWPTVGLSPKGDFGKKPAIANQLMVIYC